MTKVDLADPATAIAEAAELLGEAETVPVSARTGAGIDALRAALERAAQSCPSRAESREHSRLHIDRVFTIRGAGTVVTGTLWSGAIARGDELVVLPGGARVRARGVQVHDRAVDRAAAGQRVAVNLTGVAVSDLTRGDVLAARDVGVTPRYLLDAELRFAGREPDHGERVQVHHGTRESAARLAWLGGDFWQVRLEQSLIPVRNDRLVIRQIAPPDTLGGGRVLDVAPRKHGPSRELLMRLRRLSDGHPDEAPSSRVMAQPKPVEAAEPLRPSALALEARLRDSRFEPPLDGELDRDDLAALRAAGRAVRVSRSLHFHPDTLRAVRARVIAVARENDGAITLARLRDELGTSRKFAQALLEYLDGEKVTLRRGDVHVLRGRAAGAQEPD